MDTRWDGLLVNARLVTLAGDAGYGVIEDGALGWHDGMIVFAGHRTDLPAPPASLADERVDAQGEWVTPGLIDCHTHVVFGGDRAGEFEQRLQGTSYEDIARSGGGIVSTVRATRAASEDDLFAQSLPRARALRDDGVTTLEIKSGYGLDFDNERKMLRVARRIGDALGIRVRTTYLGAHALPPEFAGRADDEAAACVDGRHQVAAQPVSQLRRLADAPAHEVRTLSYHQAAAILQTQRPGGVDGRAAQRFFRCQAEVGAGQRHGQPQRLQG